MSSDMALTHTRAGTVLARVAAGAVTPLATTTSKSASFVVEGAGATASSSPAAAGPRTGTWGVMPTPGFMMQTSQGQPPFLMRETLATLPFEATSWAGVRYPQMWGLEDRAAAARAKAGPGAELGAFCNLQGRATLLTMRDPSKFPAPAVSDGGLSVETWFGRRPVTPASYAEAMHKMRPTVAVSLHDEIGVTAGNNRTKALAERCVGWLQFSLGAVGTMASEGAYVAPVATGGPQAGKKRKAPSGEEGGAAAAAVEGNEEGGSAASAPPAKARRLDEAGNKAAVPPPAIADSHVPRLLAFIPLMPWAPEVRTKLVEALVATVTTANASSGSGAPPVVGYALGGAFLGETREERTAALRDVLAQLAAAEASSSSATSPRLLRLLVGAGTPEDVLEGIGAGVDVFDSDLVGVTTALGHALCFQYEADEATLAAWESAGAEAAAAAGPRGEAPFSLDLNDPVYAEDARRLVEGCRCFACAGLQDELLAGIGAGLPAGGLEGVPRRPVTHPGHHRAYVNHLLRTKELLAQVLLTAHNTAWYAGFFAAARAAVAAGRFGAYRAWFLATNAATPEAVAATLAAGGTPQGCQEAVAERINPRGASRGFRAAKAAGVVVAAAAVASSEAAPVTLQQ